MKNTVALFLSASFVGFLGFLYFKKEKTMSDSLANVNTAPIYGFDMAGNPIFDKAKLLPLGMMN